MCVGPFFIVILWYGAFMKISDLKIGDKFKYAGDTQLVKFIGEYEFVIECKDSKTVAIWDQDDLDTVKEYFVKPPKKLYAYKSDIDGIYFNLNEQPRYQGFERAPEYDIDYSKFDID